MDMKADADSKDREEMLLEAMELLAGLQHYMGMFQHQYYGKLRKRVNDRECLGAELRNALNVIETS